MYEPPSYNKLPFKFSSSGYSPPDFTDVNFNFSRPPPITDLKAAIIGGEFQRDYLKHCETYVLGYSTNNVQILRHSCLYGGIRDLNAYVGVLANFLDLDNYIKSTLQEQYNLNKSLRGWAKDSKPLRSLIKGWVSERSINLPIYLKQGEVSQTDLSKYVNIFQHSQIDLTKVIKGWSTGNIRDLVNVVKILRHGTDNLSEYIKSTISQTLDLNLDVFKIWQTNQDNMNAMLHGWQVANLQKIIQVLHTKDLSVLVRSTYFTNIAALLYAISPVDIEAAVMGWDIYDLQASIARVAYDGDLNFNVYGIRPVDLNILLRAGRGFGTIKDLNVQLNKFTVSDLAISLNSTYYKDLNIYLRSTRQLTDLQVKIYPKIIHIKHHINVAFLEHRDLAAVINFPCFNSDYRDLSLLLHAKVSADLKGYIYGYDTGNLANLRFSINASEYLTQNTIPIKYIYTKRPSSYVTLNYSKNSTVYHINTISLVDSVINRGSANIVASIVGKYIQKDLSVFIRAYSNRHYDTSTVSQKFVTLKLKNNVEDFRRYVELTFNSYANSYYYFSGDKKAYREFGNDHWVVRVEGHKLLPVGKGFEKTKVRRKYIFNLKNYASIDAAIKDMVDRVTLLRSKDLNVTIASSVEKMKNLRLSIISRRIYKTNRVLRASLKCVGSTSSDLLSNIVPTYLASTINLTNHITGIDYISQQGTATDFNFVGAGDTKPDADDADFIFTLEDINDNT